jgi:hypothetical protein
MPGVDLASARNPMCSIGDRTHCGHAPDPYSADRFEREITMTKFQLPSASRRRAMAVLLAFSIVGVGSVGLGGGAVADSLPQAPVALGVAGTFAILSKTGVTDVPSSAVTGNVGASPITGAAILLSCPEVTGTIFSVDAAGPPCKVTDASLLTTAVSDMGTAYTDAAGRPNPDFVNLGAGEIGGLTLLPGLYKWNTGVSISNDVKLAGGPNDVFIFQISGDLLEAAAKNVTLVGGVQAKNVFWQLTGAAALGTTAHFEGTILSKTMVAMKTGASINGRLLAQTAVTLQSNTVTEPTQ